MITDNKYYVKQKWFVTIDMFAVDFTIIYLNMHDTSQNRTKLLNML